MDGHLDQRGVDEVHGDTTPAMKTVYFWANGVNRDMH